ncbi:MAG TPA: DUF374 domain-containing protein [Deltaproteobacteria bacterium]|nr:DUF374 domain-containing protein [Deltaproteobacteria bacterium]
MCTRIADQQKRSVDLNNSTPLGNKHEHMPRGNMKFRKEIKYYVLKYLIKYPAYFLLNLYANTVNVTLENEEGVTNYLNEGGRVILASWHQRFFGGFYLPRMFNRPISIMISKSRDGDFIADVVGRIGWRPVRGSGSRGGKKALKILIEDMKNYQLVGHIVDGPTGPPRVIKPGLISLAQHAHAAVCPTFVHYERSWTFNSWDRFMVPKPFSSAVIRFGQLVFIPSDLGSDEFENVRLCIEQGFVKGYEAGDRRWSA